MSRVRVAVLVSGGGTNLQALIDAQARGEIVNGEIVLVISSTPSAYALERAAKAGIPSCVVARKEYPSNQAMTVALVDKLKEARIDLVAVSYTHLDVYKRQTFSRSWQNRDTAWGRSCHSHCSMTRRWSTSGVSSGRTSTAF